MPEIRIIEEKDIIGYREALDSVAKERCFIGLLEAPAYEYLEKFVLNNINNKYPHVVALVDGRVIGWCDITPGKREQFAHKGTLGMGIIKEFRGRGIGTKLIQTAINAAVDIGLKRVELEVYSTKDAAIKLYRKTGFIEEGRKIKAVCLDGIYIDELIMAKLFFAN